MKFNWKWMCQESFLLVVGILAIISLCTAHKWGLPDMGFIYTFASIVALGCFACVFATISTGETYYKYHIVDKKSFQSHIFENLLLLSCNDFAWSFTSKIEEIHQLKEIKVIEYYNIKKKSVKYYLIPYQQLDEIKAADQTAKRAAKKARKKNESSA